MKRNRQQEQQPKRTVVKETTWMGETVYEVWDTLMERMVLATMDKEYARRECNRISN